MSISLNMLETFGITVKQVIHHMDEAFPPLQVSPAMTHDEIMYRAGQRSVVEWFIEQLQEDK